MPDTAMHSSPLQDTDAELTEALTIHAGQSLGQLDAADGVFDDTPPSRVPAKHADAYRKAYCSKNSSYAVN